MGTNLKSTDAHFVSTLDFVYIYEYPYCMPCILIQRNSMLSRSRYNHFSEGYPIPLLVQKYIPRFSCFSSTTQKIFTSSLNYSKVCSSDIVPW